MNNKFIAITAVISFISMLWPLFLIDTVSQETISIVGEDFCKDYNGVEEDLQESILGVLILCNDWDPVNKGLFGQDIKYQIRIRKNGEAIQNRVSYMMQFIIPLVIIGMLLDMKFNKKELKDDVSRSNHDE